VKPNLAPGKSETICDINTFALSRRVASSQSIRAAMLRETSIRKTKFADNVLSDSVRIRLGPAACSNNVLKNIIATIVANLDLFVKFNASPVNAFSEFCLI
jgi:hypothetical protein